MLCAGPSRGRDLLEDTEPKMVSPSENITSSPLGMTTDAGVTVAVNVTAWPLLEDDLDVATVGLVNRRWGAT
jgi:hypothetical protein